MHGPEAISPMNDEPALLASTAVDVMSCKPAQISESLDGRWIIDERSRLRLAIVNTAGGSLQDLDSVP
jgi:hypothetical protein